MTGENSQTNVLTTRIYLRLAIGTSRIGQNGGESKSERLEDKWQYWWQRPEFVGRVTSARVDGTLVDEQSVDAVGRKLIGRKPVGARQSRDKASTKLLASNADTKKPVVVLH